MSEYKLSHLKELEAESIHIIRGVVAEFEYQLDLLREQPLLRPLSHMQELAARNYRSFPVNNYVCLYKFEHETIYIAHIFHQSQDYARLV